MKNINDIKEELERKITEHEALLEAWQNVERVTQKDGSDFFVLSKNFKNAFIRKSPYSIYNQKEVYVINQGKNGYWNEEYISCTQLVRYSKRKVDESRIIKELLLEDRYDLTVSEIFEEIALTIEKHENCIEELKNQLNLADKYYMLVNDKLNEISNILNEVCPDKLESKNFDLRYQLEDMVHNHIFR